MDRLLKYMKQSLIHIHKIEFDDTNHKMELFWIILVFSVFMCVYWIVWGPKKKKKKSKKQNQNQTNKAPIKGPRQLSRWSEPSGRKTRRKR